MSAETGRRWLEWMIEEEPAARLKWPRGAVFEPQAEGASDANIFYTDLLAGPDETVPGPMAGYVAPLPEPDRGSS